MSILKPHVLVLTDLAAAPKDQDYRNDLDTEEWESEAHVLRVLSELGYEPKLFGLYDDLDALERELQSFKPAFVFNLCEAFAGRRDLEPSLAGYFELRGIALTGAKPTALRLAKDKALAKKVVAYHGVRVPRFEASHRSFPLKSLRGFEFPAIVKPLGLEGSTGISQASLVHSEKECLERVRFVHERFDADAIVEEFIEGRELYVGVLGRGARSKMQVLPPRELFRKVKAEGAPFFATFKAKWDDDYRARWGIYNGPTAELPAIVRETLPTICRKVCESLVISGYARIDFRLKSDDELVFIEANPNPSISAKDDFAQSALSAGISYRDLIARIIQVCGV